MNKIPLLLITVIVLFSGCVSQPRPTGNIEIHVVPDQESLDEFSSLLLDINRIETLKEGGKKGVLTIGGERFDLKNVSDTLIFEGGVPAQDYFGMEIILNLVSGFMKEGNIIVFFRSNNISIQNSFTVEENANNVFRIVLGVEKVSEKDFEMVAISIQKIK